MVCALGAATFITLAPCLIKLVSVGTFEVSGERTPFSKVILQCVSECIILCRTPTQACVFSICHEVNGTLDLQIHCFNARFSWCSSLLRNERIESGAGSKFDTAFLTSFLSVKATVAPITEAILQYLPCTNSMTELLSRTLC